MNPERACAAQAQARLLQVDSPCQQNSAHQASRNSSDAADPGQLVAIFLLAEISGPANVPDCEGQEYQDSCQKSHSIEAEKAHGS